MAFSTTVNRKTRQQKIKASAKHAEQKTVIQVEPTVAQSASMPTHLTIIGDIDYAYVMQDLRRIGWITLVCLLLLAIATVLISDLAWFTQLRQTLHLPTF